MIDLKFTAGCGYYPTYANMNHACRANTKTFKYPDQVLEVRAQEAIPRGQEISTQYVTSMKATFARRPVLRAKWFFDCLCNRCEKYIFICKIFFCNIAGLDPTECGSLLAALRCTRPAPAVSKPCGGAVLSLDPCRGEADWRCRDCGADYSCQYVVDTVRGLDITASAVND